MSLSIPGGDRFLSDNVRTLMESAVTVRECLEKETLSEAKMKRELTFTKRYKALAWEQLEQYESAHRIKTADEARLLRSLKEKANLIASLRETYADKKRATVEFVESAKLSKCPHLGEDDSYNGYSVRENWFDFLVANPHEWDMEAAEQKDKVDKDIVKRLKDMLEDPDMVQDREYYNASLCCYSAMLLTKRNNYLLPPR